MNDCQVYCVHHLFTLEFVSFSVICIVANFCENNLDIQNSYARLFPKNLGNLPWKMFYKLVARGLSILTSFKSDIVCSNKKFLDNRDNNSAS